MTTELTRRPHEPVEPRPGDPRLPEVNLYFGNDCNRDCDFCCVEGRPGGSFEPFDPDAPERILRILLPEGRVKLYGGEPTLHHEHLIGLVRRMRAAGYRGRWTVFSNGVQARRLVGMLEADPPAADHPGSDAYLNHRIWHGIGVEPIPAGRRALLEAWAEANPGRLWLSHEDVLPVGGGEEVDPVPVPGREAGTGLGDGCARCFPTVRSDGRLHACAFAAEVDAPRYDLGRLGDPAGAVAARHADFLRWVDEELEPAARAAGEAACTTCLRGARASTGLVTLTAS